MALAQFEYSVCCSLELLNCQSHRWRTLCAAQSAILPSLLEIGRAGAEANTSGICQSIAYMKILKSLHIQVLKKLQKALTLLLIKVIMNQVIPGYTFTICLE